MAFVTKGRPKGSKNKRTLEVEEIISKMKINPLQMLIHFAENQYKKLGYDSPTRTSFTSAGIEFEEEIITPELRVTALKEVIKYVYAQKKATDLTINPESQGFKIVIEDYSKEKK